jgi:Zn-dependent protease
MRFTSSRGLLIGSGVGALIGFSASLSGSLVMQIVAVVVGALVGLFASLLLVGIDYLRRPAPQLVALSVAGAGSQPEPGDIFPEASLATGGGAAHLDEPLPPDEPESRFEVSVREALEEIRNPKANWKQTLVILAVSLALFMGLHMQNSPIAFTAMLVGVLFFHELGHYLGMQIFGYRNVRMFFIPLFGAAVSGQATSGKSYQQAIVTLLGPLPGLCLALVLFAALSVPGLIQTYRIEVAQVAMLLALLNGFNLLPVLPLDGGRLLNQILFSRNRYLEGVFHVLAGFALIAYGATRDQQVLVWIGVWLLISARPTFKTNGIATHISRQFGGELPPLDAPIPLGTLRAIRAEIKSELPAVKTAKAVANVTFRVWEKMHVRPPGAAATGALLLVYLLGATVAIGTTLSPRGNRSIEFQIEQLARNTNKHLPKWIDPITRFDRVETGPGKTISFIYTLTRDLTEEQKQAFKQDSIRRALAVPDMQATYSAGVTVWYKYYDPSGKIVLEFPVTK